MSKKAKTYASYRVNGAPRTTSMNIRCTSKMKEKYSDKIKAVYQYLEECTSRDIQPDITRFNDIFNHETNKNEKAI